MKGKTKKRLSNPENGTSRNASPKSSVAPVAGNPPKSMDKESPLPNSASSPPPPYSASPPKSGPPPPCPPSLGKKKKSPGSTPINSSPSMGQRPDQMTCYPDDYGSSHEQPYYTESYPPNEMDITHAHGVDLPPYNNSQDSNRVKQNTSNYDQQQHSLDPKGHNKRSSKLSGSYSPSSGKQQLEYDSYSCGNYASSASPRAQRKSSLYKDATSIHDSDSPSSSHRYGSSSPYNHSDPSSPPGRHSPQSFYNELSPDNVHGGPPSPRAHHGSPSSKDFSGTPSPRGQRGPPPTQDHSGTPSPRGHRGPPPPQDFNEPPPPRGHHGPPPQDFNEPPPPRGHHGPPPPQDYNGPPPPRGHHGPPPSQDFNGPPSPRGHSGPPPSQDYSGPSPPRGHRDPPLQDYSGPPPPQGHHGPLPSQDYSGPPPPRGRTGRPPSKDYSGPPPPQGHHGPPPSQDYGGAPSPRGHRGPPPSQDYSGPPPPQGHHGPPPSQDYGGAPSPRGHRGPPPSQDFNGPPPPRGHSGPPPSQDYSGPPPPKGHMGRPPSQGQSGPSPQNVNKGSLSPPGHHGPPSSQGPSGPSPKNAKNRPLSLQCHSDQMYDSSSYDSQNFTDVSYQQNQHLPNSDYSTEEYDDSYNQPFLPPLQQTRRNSYVSPPTTPKGHYNPDNIEKTYQVTTPLKHVSKTTPVKKPPRSPKSPISLPFRSGDAPSPSIAAKALKNSPIEDYTNIVKTLPAKPGPQIPYKEMLPKSPKKEVFVTFPDGQMIKQFVDPNMAMMDLLIQLTASKRLNPSGYLLLALSEDGNRPVDYKANQPVGLVNSHRVKIVSKERIKTQQMSQTGKPTEKQLPFEMTYRLTVNLPHSQKVVRRMSANHPLYELHQSVCEEKNLDPDTFVLQLPDKPTSQVNLKYTLQELGLINYELNLVHRAEMEHYMSVPNLSNTAPSWIPDQSNFKPSTNATYVHMPPPGDTRKKKGFFSFLRKDKRGKSSGDLMNSNNSGKARPASMFAPMTDTFESYLKKPKKSSKKRPAPPPPAGHHPAAGRRPEDFTNMAMQQQQQSPPPSSVNYPQGEAVVNSGTDQGYHQTSQMHSRTSSDSGSYHLPHKIGTDSLTYMENSDGTNNIRRPSFSQHSYLSDIPQSAPVEDDRRPKSVSVMPVSPQGLSVPLKTANDMYASPLKKRKPAPLPPPGGPQVRPKSDIYFTTSTPVEKSSPDTPNTSSNLSVSNALDTPKSSNSDPTEQIESTNHDSSRTPLISIKTGHTRSLSKTSTTSSICTAEDVTFAFDETIAMAEKVLQNELMEEKKNTQAEGEDQNEMTLVVEQMSSSPSMKKNASPSLKITHSPKTNGAPEESFEPPAAYLSQVRYSVGGDSVQSMDTIISHVTIEESTPRKKNPEINSISSDGSFTTYGTSDISTNGVHIAEVEVCDVIKEDIEPKQDEDVITDIHVPVPQLPPAENEKMVNGKMMEHFQVNGIEIGIEKTAALTKTKIGQQVTVIRPNLETSASLELSRSSSAAELAHYMESPKEELLLTKQDRQGLDYRGSPLVEVQKKLEEELLKEENKIQSRDGSPKIMLDGFTLSIDSEVEMQTGEIETGPQGNLKKQIERWQMQLQEHLSDNSGLYTPQEQDKLKQKVDLWNKQLKELNVMDTSGFRLLEQNVLKQQIELWQRKFLAKERLYDGKKKFQEHETEFLNKQIAVWKKKIEIIEKCETPHTTEERDVLQQQIELWQSQLATTDNMDIHEKEQNLLKRQIEVWNKNLKEKKFAGYLFSQQEQDILKQQICVWEKQLQWYSTGGVSAKRDILKEQVDVWQLQLLDVQKNPSEDSKIEQEILEQQIELWKSKLDQKDILSEEIMLKQIDIWKRQTDSNRKVDDKYLVQEQMIIEKEIQLWNKRLSGEDVECENFIAHEQDLLHEKIELCQQKLKNNVEIDSPDMPLEQEILKLQVDLWQQKVFAMQEKKVAVINYKEEEQDILKVQIKLWKEKLIQPSEKNSAVAISERGTELLAKEVDLWQRWLDVKKEKKDDRIKFKLLDEELQKEQIRLWQDHLNVIKNDTLGYTEEEREILMQQIELWQKGLTERKDGKTIHLAAEQDILKKYIDLWYNKMRRNTSSSISDERDDLRQQIEIWKKQLNMYTLDDNPLSHSAQQDIINQQINIWQKKRERCSVDTDELCRIESEILQQQIELWQNDLMDYEQERGDKEMPKEQIKLLKRTLSQKKTDVDPEILAQEEAIVNRQIDLCKRKLDGHEHDSSDYINDEQKILEQQIDLWHRKLCLPVEGKAFYSESEHDILQKQVSLWHQQLVAIQHRQECQRKVAIREQVLLKEQIKLWEMKLEAFPDPVFMSEEQDAMKDQIELWQQQLEEHKCIILNKTASTPDDPELRKMELMLRSQEEIIQSFKEGLKNLPENLKTRSSPPPPVSPSSPPPVSPKGIKPPVSPKGIKPPVSPKEVKPPVPPKEAKPVPKTPIEFPPPPETFRDKEDFTAVKLKQTVPKPPPKPPTPPTPPPLSKALASLKRVSPPPERPISPPVKEDNEQDAVLRAVPAVVLKPALARKPKRKLPEPVLSPREELMLEIKNFSGRSKLKGMEVGQFWTW